MRADRRAIRQGKARSRATRQDNRSSILVGDDSPGTAPVLKRATIQIGSWAIPVDFLIPVLLVAAALALYLPRLTTPDYYTFDEYLHAFTAREYLEGNRDAYRWDLPCSIAGGSDDACTASNSDTNLPSAVIGDRLGRFEWTHPPLGLELIAGGMLVFGDGPFGRRIAAALFGAIRIALTYRLALTLTRRRIVAILTAGLLLLDGLYFVQSRIGVIDIFGTVFMIGAFLGFAHYLTTSPDRVRWPLVATGVLLGLSMAVKWNAAFAAALIGIVALWRLFQLRRASRRRKSDAVTVSGFQQHRLWVPVSLILIPVVIQILVHLPFFLEGYGLADFVVLQRERFAARTPGLVPAIRNPDGTWFNEFASRWWEWPLAQGPIRHSAIPVGDKIAVRYANGNPLLYWGFLPALVWLCRQWWRTRTPALLVLVIGFFGQWLPWMIVSHTSFIYHFLPAVPFGCLAVAVTVVHIAQSGSVWRRSAAVAYVALVALAFVFFYPIYSLYPLSERDFELRIWFESWR